MQARRLATVQVLVGSGFSANRCMLLLGGGSAASLGEEGSAEGLTAFPTHSSGKGIVSSGTSYVNSAAI